MYFPTAVTHDRRTACPQHPRRRWCQLLRIDNTYTPVRFVYQDGQGQEHLVSTLEETEYPGQYHQAGKYAHGTSGAGAAADTASGPVQESPFDAPSSQKTAEPQEAHLTFQENQKGLSYDNLFGPYLRGASKITLTDPYLRLFYQLRNLMEFVETIAKTKAADEETILHVMTVEDEFKGEQQREYLAKIQEAAGTAGVSLSWKFDTTGSLHARHIVTNHGWKISLDRGLDIFQHYEMNDAFSFANRLQQFRACKAFEVTFLRQP